MSRLLSSLEPVHVLCGRIRFRYRRTPGSPQLPTGAADWASRVHGVTEARVNARAQSIVVSFRPELTSPSRLHDELLALEAAAFFPQGPAPAAPDDPDGPKVATVVLMLVGSMLLPRSLRLLANLAAAAPLLREAADDLRQEGVSSHVLEALAVMISLARGDFAAAGTTTAMLALGETLESGIARRSDELLKHLLHPDTSRIWIEADNAEVQIDAADVESGMIVIAAAGATIPVDGTVMGGEAMVNEAVMTGESVPVTRRRGDQALSGTVVEEGRLRIYAERVGKDTASARIAAYVEQALTTRSSAQINAARLADRLVPAVLRLAGVSWLVSGQWQRAAAVLQADYSCALKLATPVAFKSAMFQAGKRGVLFKGADALERLAEADTFVFDKTGTLTTGRLEVTDSLAFDPEYSSTDLIDLAASVEEHYFHPLALAVVEAARRHGWRHFDHKEVEFIAAHGVASTIHGRRIVVGSRHFVEDDEAIPVAPHRQMIDRLSRQGKTVLYIGFGGRLLGVIALRDTVRDTAARTVQRLREQGVQRIVMLTGDHPARATGLSRRLGLDGCHAGLLPEQKVEIVNRLTEEGARVAFVGDGINDAPALAGAHVGVAMQRGADVARLTSDIALLDDDVERVADAHEMALGAMALIERNFHLTVTTNTAILAGAAFGRLSPVAASVLHNGTTIGILLNALRGGLQRSR